MTPAPKYAAGGLPFDYPGFAHTVLVDMRARLLYSARPKRIFERADEVAREAGLVGVRRVRLTPADAASLDELAGRILAFEREYERRATPFEWRFTRADLDRLLGRLDLQGAGPLAPAA